MPMTIVWGAAAVVFFVIEAATVGLASIWFAIGAICALISALLGAPIWLQIVWFIVISAATLIITRPLAKKYVNGKSQATNADRVIGSVCRVTERIDNLNGTGAVMADGKVWTARSADGETVEVGQTVTVKDIQGVKLIVKARE
jgi:membrane protein implicated in regulation of membrane protease activity